MQNDEEKATLQFRDYDMGYFVVEEKAGLTTLIDKQHNRDAFRRVR